MTTAVDRPLNLVIPAVCPDPECGEFDRCNEWCSCPMCHPSDGDREVETAAWIALAPVSSALNADGEGWAWSWTHRPRYVWNYSIEIGEDVQITYYAEQYVVQRYEVDRPATRETPQEGEWAERLVTTNPAEAAQYAVALTKESTA